MKPKDKKMKESTIGKIIYGFLLFMPLMAITITSAYTIFNKNAYQSYANNKEYQFVDNVSDFIVDNYYYLNTRNFNIKDTVTPKGAYNYKIFISQYEVLDSSFTIVDNLNSFGLYIGDNNELSIRFFGDTEYTYYNSGTSYLNLKFKYSNNTLNYNFAYNNLFLEKENESLSNVFYYSVNQVCENSLFNWTQNTFIYTSVETFTTALNINNVFFPLLLSYWMILSVVYIIFDLGLMMLQIVHRKIHELGESI